MRALLNKEELFCPARRSYPEILQEGMVCIGADINYGTLYVTYPVFSSYIGGLYGIILPVFFMSVKL